MGPEQRLCGEIDVTFLCAACIDERWEGETRKQACWSFEVDKTRGGVERSVKQWAAGWEAVIGPVLTAPFTNRNETKPNEKKKDL